MSEFPRSLIEFQRRFPDDAACAAYLSEIRWPNGFVCPECNHDKGWLLETKAFTYECARCRRQTSVKAGTIMHRSKLPLTVWFRETYLMSTHSNGISAHQVWKQLALGSYKSAWLMCAKLRRAMVNPDRGPLSGFVEVDECSIPYRTKDDPPTGGEGRDHSGKIAIIAAVEVKNKHPERIRLAQIDKYDADNLQSFIVENVTRGSIVRTDGWSAYKGMPDHVHEPHVVGVMAAHIVLPWVHRVFSNLKTWAKAVYHGLRKKQELVLENRTTG